MEDCLQNILISQSLENHYVLSIGWQPFSFSNFDYHCLILYVVPSCVSRIMVARILALRKKKMYLSLSGQFLWSRFCMVKKMKQTQIDTVPGVSWIQDRYTVPGKPLIVLGLKWMLSGTRSHLQGMLTEYEDGHNRKQVVFIFTEIKKSNSYWSLLGILISYTCMLQWSGIHMIFVH